MQPDTIDLTNVIQSSSDYDQFQFIDANRELHSAHVSNLKESIEEGGNLTQVQPILVNESFEIIDGQHRFQAVRELGLPVFYTVVPGLRVEDARRMNILHRNWNADDYLHSYVSAGKPDYLRFAEFRETYGLNHSIALMLAVLGSTHGQYKVFRQGDFAFTDYETSCLYAERINELQSLSSERLFKTTVGAFINIFRNPNYDHNQMVSKFERFGSTFSQYIYTEDTMRSIEELYNFRNHEGNRVRLF